MLHFISSDSSNYLQLYSHCIQFYNIFSKHFSGICAISGYFYHLQDFIFHYLPFEESNLFVKILLKHQNYHLSHQNYIVMDSNNLGICKNDSSLFSRYLINKTTFGIMKTYELQVPKSKVLSCKLVCKFKIKNKMGA